LQDARVGSFWEDDPFRVTLEAFGEFCDEWHVE
jgi:hypothetical protein